MDVINEEETNVQRFVIAMASGDLDAISSLLDSASNEELEEMKKIKGMGGISPAHSAAEEGNMELLKKLTEKGFDPDEKDDSGSTPLCWASGEGKYECAHFLLTSGASVSTQDELGETPLHWAALNGHKRTLSLLLGFEEDIPLTWDLNVNQQSASGQTALHNAAINCFVECVALLLEAGSDPGIKSNTGQTAKDIVISRITAKEDQLPPEKRRKLDEDEHPLLACFKTSYRKPWVKLNDTEMKMEQLVKDLEETTEENKRLAGIVKRLEGTLAGAFQKLQKAELAEETANTETKRITALLHAAETESELLKHNCASLERQLQSETKARTNAEKQIAELEQIVDKNAKEKAEGAECQRGLRREIESLHLQLKGMALKQEQHEQEQVENKESEKGKQEERQACSIERERLALVHRQQQEVVVALKSLGLLLGTSVKSLSDVVSLIDTASSLHEMIQPSVTEPTKE